MKVKGYGLLLAIIFSAYTISAFSSEIVENTAPQGPEVTYKLEPVSQRDLMKLLKVETTAGICHEVATGHASSTSFNFSSPTTTTLTNMTSTFHMDDELKALCKRFHALKVQITNNGKRDIKIPVKDYLKNFINVVTPKEDFIETYAKIIKKYFDDASFIPAYFGFGLSALLAVCGIVPCFIKMPMSQKIISSGTMGVTAGILAYVSYRMIQDTQHTIEICSEQKDLINDFYKDFCVAQLADGSYFVLSPGQTLFDLVFIDTDQASELEVINSPSSVIYF
jgi:hypothetical protein